jgi:hypothetical protein
VRWLSLEQNQSTHLAVSIINCKCLYDHSDPDAICANCLRRGLKCGIKIPGPKSQPEVIPMSRGQDRSASQYKDYMRIYHKFKKLRPEDAPANISKLVELVENGTLREEGDKLAVVSLDLGMDLSILGIFCLGGLS